MAKKLQMAPEAQAALDELTRTYGGSLPARLSIYWMRPVAEGGPVQIPDPTTATGQFEVPVSDLAEGNLEQWILGHPALGGSRSYRVLVFVPRPDGTYPPRPNRTFPLSYVDPMENALQVEASRTAQAAASVAAVNTAADAVLDAAGRAAGEVATAQPDVADKLTSTLSQFTSTLGNAMSQFNRFGQTPLPPAAPSGAYQVPTMPGAPYGYPMPPAGYPYPPPPSPWGYPPAPPQPASSGGDKMAEALIQIVTQRQQPQTDPMVLNLLQQQQQLLQQLVSKQAAAPTGPSADVLEIQRRLDAAERAADQARMKAESDRKEFELKAQLLDLQRKLEAGSGGKTDQQLEFMKLQAQQQAESARVVQSLMERMQTQANEFNKELRETLSQPGPDQGQQITQMAKAMGEVMNFSMASVGQAIRMQAMMGGGGGGGEGGKKPGWYEPAEKAVGVLAGLGQSIMASLAPGGGMPLPVEEPPLQLGQQASDPQQQPQQALPPTQAAPALPAPPPPPSPDDFVRRARQLATGADFIGAIRTLEAAFQVHPGIIQNGDRIKTVATLLDDVQWPETTTAEAIEGAYVAVYGEAVREHLARLVSEERDRAARDQQAGGEQAEQRFDA